jgi:hypothetical protein
LDFPSHYHSLPSSSLVFPSSAENHHDTRRSIKTNFFVNQRLEKHNQLAQRFPQIRTKAVDASSVQLE